ncbi:hypothetical protein SIO70_00830 [Chitinophaga sancti]|uniref:McrC family protein n=1 Tax=Chitinophaga sancti TaxID=1004 RepID=UPI002A757234|nr:hypothetical protein [Chitinophaga sancti]WPQ63406.1 hypothetical protein SIO70_00830 [Chitinophaga sancti]
MANKNIIRVAEYEKLYYDNDKPFKKKHWEALCLYHARNEIEHFQIIDRGIRFINYVGGLQAGELTIEILPKTDRHLTTAANCNIQHLENDDANARANWHEVLLSMLKECRFLQVHHSDKANLNLRSNSILDIYIQLFLEQTEKILHEGLTKQYRKEEGNRLAMKGQLLFSKNISQNLVHQERFYVRHTVYNVQNKYNQLLYMTLLLISKLCNDSLIIDKAHRLLLHFPEMATSKVTEQTFSSLAFDRKTERYKEALLISKLLLLNYRPGINGGSEQVIAILFDMNMLWEEFIYHRIQKAAAGYAHMRVYRQSKKDFWYHNEYRSYKKVKPDIVVEMGEEIYILDTKWKVVDGDMPGDDDLKQLFVYNLLWNARQSFLVYPGSFNKVEGSYVHFPLSAGEKRQGDDFYSHCGLVFVNPVAEGGGLSGRIGEELLGVLKE